MLGGIGNGVTSMPAFLRHPYSLVFWATLIWGLSGIYIKWVEIPVVYMASLRTLTPVLCILAWAFWKKEKLHIREQPKSVWFASGFNILRTLCYFAGFSQLPIAQGIVLMYTWPIWVVLLEGLFFKIPFERRQFVLMLLAFCGILIVQGIGFGVPFSPQSMVGGSLLLVAALANALMMLCFKKTNHTQSGIQSVFYQNLVGSVVFLPFLYMGLSLPLWKTVLSIVAALVIGIVGYVLFFAAMRRMSSSRVALLAYFEVLTNIFWATLLLNEGISARITFGGALILIAAILMRPAKTPVEPHSESS